MIATDNGDSTWTIYMVKNGKAGSKALDYSFMLNPTMSLSDAVRETALAAPQMLLENAKDLYPDLLVEFSDEGGRAIKKAIVSRKNGYSNSDHTVFSHDGWSSVSGGDLSSTGNTCLVIYPSTTIDLFTTLSESELASVKTIKISMHSEH